MKVSDRRLYSDALTQLSYLESTLHGELNVN